ncbi:hypothetical protein HK101_007148 [Irineochytrium annulatum]|nr:hypothetical protein HK101_007148 [Irineochytrium annulatum]
MDSIDSTASAASMHRANLRNISMLLEHDKVDQVLELVDQMVQYEIELDGGGQPTSPPPGGRTGLAAAAPSSSSGEKTLAPSVPANKNARQRKLQKLTKFFGDQLNPVQLMEQSIVAEIERSFEEEVTDPVELEGLRRELDHVRAQMQEKSGALTKGMEERAMKDLREASGPLALEVDAALGQ